MGYLNKQLEKRAFRLHELLAGASPIIGGVQGYLHSTEDNQMPAAMMGSAGATFGAIPAAIVGENVERPITRALEKYLPKKWGLAANLAGKAVPLVGTLGGGYLGAELGTKLGDNMENSMNEALAAVEALLTDPQMTTINNTF